MECFTLAGALLGGLIGGAVLVYALNAGGPAAGRLLAGAAGGSTKGGSLSSS
jgi:hypothetical protein